jgi:UDP-N-acetylglucosamine/UDP-N-acetylgalactosamine diphosphorylase
VGTLFTFQVDNPLLSVCRPDFVGHHALAGASMSTMAVRKVGPEEKMGVVARVDGRTGVVEYSDLPDELARQRDAEGELAYWAGSIAVHCIELDFVRELTDGGLRLSYHRALKRVSHVGDPDPDEPNAVKFETFLFDALPAARRTVTMEVRREDEFSPIKNAEGADSPETARRDLNRLYARWLTDAGVPVPQHPDGEPVDLEIDPRFALDAQELAEVLPLGFRVEGPTVLSPDSLSPPGATP